MELRRVGPEDHETVTKALQTFGNEAGDCAAFLARDETRCYVAMDGDVVVGYAYGHELVHPDGERTMLLYSVKIVPSHFGRGTARELAKAFVEGARAEGCSEAWALTDAGKVGDTTVFALAGARREPETALVFVWPFGEGQTAWHLTATP